jgi:hypothetical protein
VHVRQHVPWLHAGVVCLQVQVYKKAAKTPLPSLSMYHPPAAVGGTGTCLVPAGRAVQLLIDVMSVPVACLSLTAKCCKDCGLGTNHSCCYSCLACHLPLPLPLPLSYGYVV